MSNNEAYAIINIPTEFSALAEYKKCRKIGLFVNGAVLIGLLELFINLNKFDQIDQMIKTTQLSSEDKVKKMRECLLDVNKFSIGTQKQGFILEFLKSKDQHNSYANAFFSEYMKRKSGTEKFEKELQQFLLTEFKVQLIICLQQQTALEIKEKQYIILLKYESYYYLVMKEPELSKEKCRSCSQEKSDFWKMKCNHVLCFSCLKRLFSNSSTQSVSCPMQNCPLQISKNEYLTKINNLKSNNTQKISQESSKLYVCTQCKNRILEDQLLRPQNCNHMFCQPCLRKVFSVSKSSCACLTLYCKGKFELEQLEYFLRSSLPFLNSTPSESGQNKLIQNNQMLQSSIKAQITIKGLELSIIQCCGCFKQYKKDFIYHSQCGHDYCKNCCDKEISQDVSKFQCYSSKCSFNIEVQQVQLYFYQQIRNQTFQSCSNCNEETKITDSFQSNCSHIICFNCVKNIHSSQRTPICKKCGSTICEDDLDQFCIQRQLNASEKEFQQIDNKTEHVDKEFQISCTFCSAPFSEYNTQQDLLCQQHIVGACCIIFPLNCPQCELISITIHKEKLKFELLPQDEESWKYSSSTQSPIFQYKA